MKLITFAVPCYNSANYMKKCVESLLHCGQEAEIILIDDGSTKDNTPQLCDEYAATYPNIIRVIHQENGGHGEGVYQGLCHATGLYYKVVDSDDWLDTDSLQEVMVQLRKFSQDPVDMLITNYVYEHTKTNSQQVVSYNNVLPKNTLFTWSDIGNFRPSQYLLMHSIIYRTELLRDCKLTLPKHTFYVDNLFVYQPLPFVQTLYYLDVNLYRYFIGRDDQSVNESIMLKRVDQQILVTKLMMDAHSLKELRANNRKLGHYMTNYLAMMMTISSILLLKINSKESLQKKADLWQYLLDTDVRLYRMMKYKKVSSLTMFPGKLGRKTSLSIYNIARRIYKFN